MYSLDGKTVYVKENNVFICLDGPPTPLKRHRSCILNGMVHSYDSQKDFKKTVLKRVLEQVPSDFVPFNIPIEMLVEFHMPIPESWSKKKRRDYLWTPHSKTPDLSNLIKFFEDVFNGILYRDDSLISKIYATKIYSMEPKTIVCIREYYDTVSEDKILK